MHIHCPHCRSPVEVVEDQELRDVICPSCGSSFNLLPDETVTRVARERKQVIYTSIGKPREDDPLYPVYVQFERFRAAQYSRELSDKVWRGCVRIAQ